MPLDRRGFLASLLIVPAAVRVWSAPPGLEKFQWIEHPQGSSGGDDPWHTQGSVGFKATVRHQGQVRIYGDWVIVNPEYESASYRTWLKDELRQAARNSLRELGVPFREWDIA